MQISFAAFMLNTALLAALIILVACAVNLVGDWLRDALNPKLQ